MSQEFMNVPFKDPIKAEYRKSSRPFVDPTKEQATTGRFFEPGDWHGTGFNQPVGKFEASNKGGVPQESKAFSPEGKRYFAKVKD